MGKTDIYNPSKEGVVMYLEKRFNYLVNEYDGKIDGEEILALIDAIRSLDPGYFEEEKLGEAELKERVDKVFEACERREGLEKQIKEKCAEDNDPVTDEFLSIFSTEELEQLLGARHRACDIPVHRETKKPKKFRYLRMPKVVAAAVLAMIIFASGTAGIYAERSGFFQTIRDNRENTYIVTNIDDIASNGCDKYFSINDIPMQYVKYTWLPSNLPEDIPFDHVSIYDDSVVIMVNSCFIDKETGKFLTLERTEYRQSGRYSDEIHDSLQMVRSEIIDGLELRYYKKENDDYTDYMIIFYYQKSKYAISTNINMETIEEIVKQYIQLF